MECIHKNGEKWIIYDRIGCGCSGDEGCTVNCESFSKIPFEKIGAFLFEPGSSSGQVRFPSKGLIEKITSNIRLNNGVIVVNEVTTGIGRTGKWFGYNHYALQPDVVAVGKGLGKWISG